MALIYKAVLNPSKLDLLDAWLPSRPWFTGAGELCDEGLTTIVCGERFELVVVRVVGADALGEHTLSGRWADGGPVVLASVRRV